jgi:hypothetical protein
MRFRQLVVGFLAVLSFCQNHSPAGKLATSNDPILVGSIGT